MKEKVAFCCFLDSLCTQPVYFRVPLDSAFNIFILPIYIYIYIYIYRERERERERVVRSS